MSSEEIIRCPVCGSEVYESEDIFPPRLVCVRRACDGQRWVMNR